MAETTSYDASASPLVVTVAPSPEARVVVDRMRDFRYSLAERPRHAKEPAPAKTVPVLGAPVAKAFERDGSVIRPIFPDLTNLPAESQTVGGAQVAGSTHRARTTYPATANQAFQVQDEISGVSVEATLRGTTPAAAEVGDGFVVYRRAGAGRFGDVVHRPTATGTEDYIVLDGAPSASGTSEVVYDVVLGRGVAGLRQIGDFLEFVDSQGTPRLHVADPYLVDAAGKIVKARLTVEGCDVDTNPAGPWGRPATPAHARRVDAAGAPVCEVHVAWASTDVKYPAVLDPTWATSGPVMTCWQFIGNRAYGGHQSFVMLTLPNKKVMAIGGETAYHSGVSSACSELFDPATQVWSKTGAMTYARAFHTGHVLTSGPNSGKVLVAGGLDGARGLATNTDVYTKPNPLNTYEIYDVTAGTWTLSGKTLNQGRAGHRSVILPSGDVFVTGGVQAYENYYVRSAEYYTAATDTWTRVPDMSTAREGHVMEVIDDGGAVKKVLVSGGFNKTNQVPDSNGICPGLSGSDGDYLVSTQIFDPSTMQWVAGKPMPAATENGIGRWSATSTVLGDGKILVVGGYNDNCCGCTTAAAAKGQVQTYLGSAVLYDPKMQTWTPVGALQNARYAHSATVMAGRVVVIAGYNASNYLTSVEVYDPATKTFTVPPRAPTTILEARGYHGAAVVDVGTPPNVKTKILIAGGGIPDTEMDDPPNPTDSTKKIDIEADWTIWYSELYDNCIWVGCPCDNPASDCSCIAAAAAGDTVNRVCNTCCNGSCAECDASTNFICTPRKAADPGVPACAPYVCDGTSLVCVACKSDADCAGTPATPVCSCEPATAGKCVALQDNGKCCKVDGNCKSTACVDSATAGAKICCSSKCDQAPGTTDLCGSCNLPGLVGQCSPRVIGSMGAPQKCGGDVLCNGTSTKCPACTSDRDCPSGAFCSLCDAATKGQCLPLGTRTLGQCCESNDAVCASKHCVDNGNGMPSCCDTAKSDCSARCQTCGANGVCPSTSLCFTTCNTDQDCVTAGKGLYCDCTHQCQAAKIANGQCCVGDSICQSNTCVTQSGATPAFTNQGVCCDSRCNFAAASTQLCGSCFVPGRVGTCSAVSKGLPGAPTKCSGDVLCDGTNTTCQPCKTDTDCPGGEFCQLCGPNAGKCAPVNSIALGQCCTTNPQGNQCVTSSFCVDNKGAGSPGICCDKLCGDVGSECGECRGAVSPNTPGKCGPRTAGDTGSPKCQPGNACDGKATACQPTGCTMDAECATGLVCGCADVGGKRQCVPPQDLGKCCLVDKGCLSNHCIDDGAGAKFCCDAVCDGDCESCAVAGGTKGVCKPVTPGKPKSGCCNGTDSKSSPSYCSCKMDSECGTGKACVCGTCGEKKKNGSDCESACECASGFCVDNVCCNTACTGCCETCTVDTYTDAGAIRGICQIAEADREPVRCCQPYACDGVHSYCPKPCTDDNGCVEGACCLNGVCVTAPETDGGGNICHPNQVYTGGGSCAVGGGRGAGGPAGLLLLLGAVVAFGLRRRRGALARGRGRGRGRGVFRRGLQRARGLVASLFVAAIVVGVGVGIGPLARDAAAQAMPGTGFQLNRYEPTSAGNWMWSVEHPWYSSTRYFAAGLTLDYAHNPLMLRALDSSGGYVKDGASQKVANQFQIHVDIAGSFLDRVTIAASLPINLVMGGPLATDKDLGAGVGDPRIGAMVRLFNQPDEDRFSASLGVNVWIPIGSDSKLLGDGKVRFQPRVVAGGRMDWLRWSLNLAFTVRSENTVPGETTKGIVGNELNLGLGLQYVNKARSLAVGPEFGFGTMFTSGDNFSRNTGIDMLLGVNYLVKNTIMVGVAPGLGLLLAPGTPDFRLLARIAYAPIKPPKCSDKDNDEVCDKDDVCPDVHKGEHPDPSRLGCPLSDRDKDGVYDKDDVCPDVPKGDHPDPSRLGCPLGDRDADGVYDKDDICPDVPKGDHPDPDRLGCPLGDRDGDGVYDKDDICPEVPMGPTPDPKRLGCPLVDTDKDGINDSEDVCPTETRYGPQGPDPRPEKLGCPAKDTDSDGIFDGTDVCPTESRFGPHGPDPDPKFVGCPLRKVDPHVKCDSNIKIREQPRFANDKFDLYKPPPYKLHNQVLLDDVASILRNFPAIKKVRVEGHTSHTGTYKHNLVLSNNRANAVKQWLVTNDGIEDGRLDARGFAWDRPICGLDIKAAPQRRVEFKIMEEEGCPAVEDKAPVCGDSPFPVEDEKPVRGKKKGAKAGGKGKRKH